MKILATGISGVGKKAYFKRVRELGKLNGVDIAIYDAGKMLFDVANRYNIDINTPNTLNIQDNFLKLLMGTVYDRIAEDIPRHDHAIISTHALFFWKKINRDSSNAFFLNKIDPDMYLTVIDTPDEIRKRLNRNEKWKKENLSLENVVLWQDYEMMVTSKYWAGIMGVMTQGKPMPYLALPKNQPPESLLKLLLFHPNIKPVYCAFPMTNLQNPEESNQKINEFIQAGGGPLLGTDVGLRDFYVVLDPRTYELKMGATDIENAHTVHRDLEYFVGYTDATICYFPEITYSSGATNEMKEAHDRSKDVYLTMDKDKRSPFVDFHLTHDIFRHPRDFFEFLKEKEEIKKLKRPEGYGFGKP